MAGRRRRFFSEIDLDGPDGPSHPEPAPEYECSSPSPKEVLEVKALLLMKLPLEIVDVVIEHAEYWPCITVSTGGKTTTIRSYQGAENLLILRTFPLGYYPATSDNGLYNIPHENYLTKANIAHKIESSDALQPTTSDVLSLWKARSVLRVDNPCRKLVFTIKSRDQGWGSERRLQHGVYEYAWSWFDVGIERFAAIDTNKITPENPVPEGFIEQFRLEPGDVSQKIPTSIACDMLPTHPAVVKDPESPSNYKYDHPFQATGTRLQSNRTANPEVMEHVITWSSDDCIDPNSTRGAQLEAEGRGNRTGNGDFVRNLKTGDIITVWARCRFGGWTNDVEEVKIDVYWGV